jgi:hypothetical protein
MKKQSYTKDQILSEIEKQTYAFVDSDGTSARVHSNSSFYGYSDDSPTARNLQALVKPGKIVMTKDYDYLLNIDHAPMQIEALQGFIKGWTQNKLHDVETGRNVRRFVGVKRCDAWGKDNQCSENHYVLDPERKNYIHTIWAPDVDPMVYTDAAIHAESFIQNAEQTIARIEYQANVNARKAYFARLAGL